MFDSWCSLKWMQAKAGDQPESHHGQYFLKQAIWNYKSAKLLHGDPGHTDNPYPPTYASGREQPHRTRQSIETSTGSCKEQGDKKAGWSRSTVIDDH
jgi:hypothetical protein